MRHLWSVWYDGKKVGGKKITKINNEFRLTLVQNMQKSTIVGLFPARVWRFSGCFRATPAMV
jgi:hypothetical protein